MSRPFPSSLLAISLLSGSVPQSALAAPMAASCLMVLPDSVDRLLCQETAGGIELISQQPEVVPPDPDPALVLPDASADPPSPSPSDFDLDPTLLESSPLLRDWLDHTPDIADEIKHDPSFRTRLQLGYSQYPSTQQTGGFAVGLQDVFIWPGTGLTLSGSYDQSWNGTRRDYGAEARYYLLPLGGYVNLAPVVGYQSLETPNYSTDGLNIGFRFMLVPSRGGGADLAISQSWVAPGSQEEVGLTGVTLGYAVTHHLRLSTNLQFQNSRFGQDSRLGLGLEWLM